MSWSPGTIHPARSGTSLGALQTRKAKPAKPQGANGKLDHALVAQIKRELKRDGPEGTARLFWPSATKCQVYSIWREESYRYVDAAP